MLNKAIQIDRKILFVLQLAAIGVLVGRGWQHIFGQTPYWTIIWDQQLLEPLVNNWFKLDWSTFVESEQIGVKIQQSIKVIGFGYILIALCILFVRKLPGLLLATLAWLAFMMLLLLSIAYTKAQFFRPIQLFEYSLQAGTPLILWSYVRNGWRASWLRWVSVLIALTFICHGWYALGFYFPRPAHFTEMTMAILSISQDYAEWFLILAGVMDVIASVGLFMSNKRVQLAAIWYCAIWGFLTALARIWAHFDLGWWEEVLWQWGPEFLYRMPHFLIPLALLYGLRKPG